MLPAMWLDALSRPLVGGRRWGGNALEGAPATWEDAMITGVELAVTPAPCEARSWSLFFSLSFRFGIEMSYIALMHI